MDRFSLAENPRRRAWKPFLLHENAEFYHTSGPNYPVSEDLPAPPNLLVAPCYIVFSAAPDMLRFPKRALNVDSPSFTPASLASNLSGTMISSRAASAGSVHAQRRCKCIGASTPNLQTEEPAAFNPAHIREFTPQNYDLTNSTTLNGSSLDSQVAAYDPFAISSASQAVQNVAYNPYADDSNNLAGAGTGYYPSQTSYTATAQPILYHLYAPIGPHKDDLLAYQRLAHDFFMPEKLREDLQKKSEASLQVMPGSKLPIVENYHTLVPLDTSGNKNTTIFGYHSWVYKATSAKNGKIYVLRRLEGYRLSHEKAIRLVKDWRRVNCGSVVTVHDAFTTRAFNDSSLIFVTDYHPLSKTIAENHLANTSRYGTRANSIVPEQLLWGYIVQIASAIKSVHAANLAVRCMEPSKVILTDKNRVRFSACSVLDVVQYEAQRSLAELQQEDLYHFGKLILSVATNNNLPQQAINGAIDHLGRSYTMEMRDCLKWLLKPEQPPLSKSIDDFLRLISGHLVTSYDSALHAQDTLTSELSSELENGRLTRLMMKLGSINERPDFDAEAKWSEHGERYMLKLFRDYVFHQVDANGNPVIDLGHMIRCLNKLDVGVDERLLLTSRDDQAVFVVTYKDLKKQVNLAFGDLLKAAKPTRGF